MPVHREEMMLITPAGQAEISRVAQVSGSDVYAFAPTALIAGTGELVSR